jgi:DNA-binding NtrC family response regulator
MEPAADFSALVVDDDRELRELLVRMLGGKGFAAEGAATGEEALARARAGDLDLVLLDLQLPGIDGLATLAGLRAERPLATVVLMTAHATIETAVRAIQLGAFDYVTKPVKLEQVLATAGAALEARALARELRYSAASIDTSEGRTILSRDAKMIDIFERVTRVADTQATVLVTGETGTGKELVARALHAHSPRRGAPFVAVNCAALPAGLEESELFGHEKGAFTGAIARRVGRFEQAHRGTLFLDEVAELPPSAQAKLLRVLQERTFERVGGTQPIDLDIRIIAATHQDLRARVAAGSFRQDLFYRLNVIPITLPPLRERPQDVPLLASYFVEKYNLELGRAVDPFLPPQLLSRLSARAWPGNIRELQNVIQRGVALSRGTALELDSADDAPVAPDARPLDEARAEFERGYLTDVLARSQGNVSRAARSAGLSRASFYEKMKKLGIG